MGLSWPAPANPINMTSSKCSKGRPIARTAPFKGHTVRLAVPYRPGAGPVRVAKLGTHLDNFEMDVKG
eukprot:10409542-Alexandrium_andersonii.AAC.1